MKWRLTRKCTGVTKPSVFNWPTTRRDPVNIDLIRLNPMRRHAMLATLAILAGCSGPPVNSTTNDSPMRSTPNTVDIAWLESEYSIIIPERHRRALLDRSDPIHASCEFLLLDDTDVIIPIAKTNAFFRTEQNYEWPDYMFAFASHAFGDYYVYDTRSQPYRVIYIDPDLSMAENLTPSPGDLRFDSFDDWYDNSLKQDSQ